MFHQIHKKMYHDNYEFNETEFRLFVFISIISLFSFFFFRAICIFTEQ